MNLVFPLLAAVDWEIIPPGTFVSPEGVVTVAGGLLFARGVGGEAVGVGLRGLVALVVVVAVGDKIDCSDVTLVILLSLLLLSLTWSLLLLLVVLLSISLLILLILSFSRCALAANLTLSSPSSLV